MSRIRSIKPEFPQSESMGMVSREARLTFLQLWTLADDEGRLRGNSRMLASLLFPYDDDAPALIDGWMSELEREDCIVRYTVGGQSYVEIRNWLIHQKIDKPSKSKLPSFANSREDSRSVVVGREGKGEEGKGEEAIIDPTNPDELVDIIPPKRNDCPHAEIIALYHEILPMCPQVREWTPTRADHLRARWREDESRQNLDYWRTFFEYVKQCPFLLGREPPSPGRKAFFADLEWMVKLSNFTKIREGKYE